MPIAKAIQRQYRYRGLFISNVRDGLFFFVFPLAGLNNTQKSSILQGHCIAVTLTIPKLRG